MESPLIDKSESESAPRSRRPSAENTPSPTSSSAASSAGDADGRAADDDHVAVADRRLASSSRFGHLALRSFRATTGQTPATIPTPALAAARTPSRTLNPLNADTFVAAAAQFAGEVAGTEVDAEAKDLAAAAFQFAAGTRGSADDLVRAAATLSKAATGTPFAVQSMDLLVCTSCLVVIPEETETECLVRTTHEFVTAAQGSSMEDGAKLFARAVDAFAAGKFRSVKVADTELCRMGQMLEQMARMAPDTEKKLAEIAIAIVGESSILLLEVDDAPPSRPSSTAKRVDLVSCLCCLQACFSTAPTTPRVKPGKLSQKTTTAPTAVPVLPLHRHEVKRQAKIVDQRTFIFGLTLSTTIALFTTMKVESVMSAEVAAWVGGGSAIAWLCVNVGSMMNLYGQSIFEQRAAQHLSRLGMMGLALLFCLSMYAWFFPHLPWLLWILIGLTTALHGVLWLLSCLRHDDDSRLSDEDLCMCPRCKPSCTCCINRGSRAHAVESV